MGYSFPLYLLILTKMTSKIQFEFSGKIWHSDGPGGWYFISLPIDISAEIRNNLRSEEEGWGRLKARAKIGNTDWDSAIWFATKLNTYLLPLKAEVRKKEKLEKGKVVSVVLWL